jgi:diacylglycerol kinase (ATP)
MLHALCIYNQRARRALTRLDEVRLQLRRHDYEVEFKPTAYRLHAIELARQAAADNADLVIAAGGDGTVNEVACGLALSTVPLAILPCGTGNVLAKELGLPNQIRAAVELISKSKPTRIALGKGGSRYFAMMAGVGVDAQILYHLNAKMKQAFGEVAFWLEALRHWTTNHRLARFSVDVDGKVYQTTFAIISRIARYAGGVKITSTASLRSDQFDICMFKGTSRLDYLRYLSGVIWETHPHFHDVVYTRGTLVRMTAEEQIRVQMDGEIIGTLPMVFEFVPNALTLLIPPRGHH